LSTYFNFIPAKNVKNFNKHAALDLIRFTPGGISRVQLSQRLGLTRAGMSAIANDLLASKVIREIPGKPANTGRPPITLEINPGRGTVAGIDIGATHQSIIIADCAAHVLEEKEAAHHIQQGPQAGLDQAEAMLVELLGRLSLRIKDLLAIGVGVPGPVVSEAGMVLSPPIMPGWDRFPIRATLEKRWGRPVSLNNDAELGAVGEWAYGAGRGVDNLAYIKVGTGVGAGLLLNGHIYRGASGSAGEIGHITIDENGRVCTCGNRGCLETLVGGTAIAFQAQEAIRGGQPTQLAEHQPHDQITAAQVAAEARRGDLAAQKILSDAGAHLGIAIAGLVNLINPDMIVVGGGIAQIGDLFLEPVRKAVQDRSLSASARTVRITTAMLGRRSIGLGAVVQALSLALHRIADGKRS
jgi:glucokinase-like ROK family protein